MFTTYKIVFATVFYTKATRWDRWTCHEIIAGVLEPNGISYEDIPDTMDLFMNYHHDCAEHKWIIDYPVSKPDDFIEFEAMMPLLVGLSNCPMDVLAPCNAYNCTQVKVEIRG